MAPTPLCFTYCPQGVWSESSLYTKHVLKLLTSSDLVKQSFSKVRVQTSVAYSADLCGRNSQHPHSHMSNTDACLSPTGATTSNICFGQYSQRHSIFQTDEQLHYKVCMPVNTKQNFPTYWICISMKNVSFCGTLKRDPKNPFTFSPVLILVGISIKDTPI